MSVNEDIEGADAFAGKPRSHGNRGCHKGCERHVTCGSGLARESGVSVNEDIECADAFAGKPRSHGNRGLP
ncbi:hypothetical protein C3E97_001935 [Pseudomonas sp. MWU12-2115]|nr:hypothetical protein C3E97_001935 [Pseudomonas sp. MWU12-2115]